MSGDNPRLFVRWSEGPDVDVRRRRSLDDLTRTELAGLSANALAVVDHGGGDRCRSSYREVF